MINPESNFTRFDASWKTRKYAVAFIFCVTILFQIVAVKCEKLSQDSLAARHGLKSVCDTDVNIFAEKLIELALASTHQPEKLRRDKLEAKVQQLVNQERSRPKHEQVVAAKFYLFACNPTTYEVSKRMNTFKEMTKPKGFNCFGLAWRLSGTDRREHATVMMVAGMKQTESGRHAPAPARLITPSSDRDDPHPSLQGQPGCARSCCTTFISSFFCTTGFRGTIVKGIIAQSRPGLAQTRTAQSCCYRR